MFFWLFMLAADMVFPVVMVVSGYMMWKSPPKTINGIVGYRTRMSKKSKDTWFFAHECCGKLWWKLGWIMLLLSVAVMLLLMGSSEAVIGSFGGMVCFLECIPIPLSIFFVEKKLKENFDVNGERIEKQS